MGSADCPDSMAVLQLIPDTSLGTYDLPGRSFILLFGPNHLGNYDAFRYVKIATSPATEVKQAG